MASRSYRHTRIHMLGHRLLVVLEKLGRVLRIALVSMCVFAFVDILVLLVENYVLHRQCNAFDVADWMLRFRSDTGVGSFYKGLSQSEQLVGYSLGMVYWAIVTGFMLEAIIRPARLVRFSRFVVIDTIEDCLKIRYWVRLLELQYLADASIDIIFEIQDSRYDGSSSKHVDFRYIDPKDGALGIDEYFGIRGVRTTDIPFTPVGKSDRTSDLKGALRGLAEHREGSFIRVRVKGQSPDGTSVLYEKRYTADDVLFGYKFTSTRRDEIEEQRDLLLTQGAKLGKLRRTRTKAVMFMEHLDMVTRIVWAPSGPRPRRNSLPHPLYALNRPDAVYVLKPGECIGAGHRLRVMWRKLVVFGEKCRKHMSRWTA